jgi:pimeloyl-ACP methyl ester carboxylesterase
MIVPARFTSATLIALLGLGAGLGIAVLATRDTPPPDAITRYDPERETRWTTLQSPPPKRIILLVHGLDEPGSIWDELAPAIDDQGACVARFEYPHDQHIALSATLFQQSLLALRDMGVERVDLVCHSMGGLVARDALSRDPEDSDDDGARDIVDRLILVGTPNAGSSWARTQSHHFASPPSSRLLRRT